MGQTSASAMRWTQQKKRDVFGVYLGFAPGFHPNHAAPSTRGVVGGHKVSWYRRDPSSDPEFSQETLVKLDRQGSVAHVWVTANSHQQLLQRLAILSRLEFR